MNDVLYDDAVRRKDVLCHAFAPLLRKLSANCATEPAARLYKGGRRTSVSSGDWACGDAYLSLLAGFQGYTIYPTHGNGKDAYIVDLISDGNGSCSGNTGLYIVRRLPGGTTLRTGGRGVGVPAGDSGGWYHCKGLLIGGCSLLPDRIYK